MTSPVDERYKRRLRLTLLGAYEITQAMELLWTLFIGLIVGIVAKFFMPGRDGGGIIATSLLGVVGAMVAGFLGRAFNWYLPGEPVGFIAAVLGAMIVLFVYRQFKKR